MNKFRESSFRLLAKGWVVLLPPVLIQLLSREDQTYFHTAFEVHFLSSTVRMNCSFSALFPEEDWNFRLILLGTVCISADEAEGQYPFRDMTVFTSASNCEWSILWSPSTRVSDVFHVYCFRKQLKGQCREIFNCWFFHESVSPNPLSISLGQFQIFSKIR